METDLIKKRINSALDVADWNIYNDYKAVSVLALYWQEADHAGFQEEARNLGTLFSKEFHYRVDYFPIPSENSHLELDKRVNLLLTEHGHADHLLIIYYGGHGDPNNDEGENKLAIWAAHARDGPVINWSIIQPKLGEVKAEFLLLFDCCFAAQAARASRDRAIPSNVELLAACAMNVKTILPGPNSFTSNLIKFLENSLKTTGAATISDVAIAIAYRNSGYFHTPIHFSGLGGGRSTSICLKPFDATSVNSIATKQEATWLTLKVSLRDTLTDSLISEIVHWLKAHPKRKVTRLAVENVVSAADHLRHFIYNEGGKETEGPRFDHLDPFAKKDVLMAWTKFQSLLARLAMQLRSSSSSSHDANSGSTGCINNDLSSTLDGPLTTLVDLEASLLSLQNTVQRSVMAIPNLYEDREALVSALESMAMQDLGLVPLLERRLKARFSIDLDDSMKTEHITDSELDKPTKFSGPVKENITDLGSVLVEYKNYEANWRGLNVEFLERRIQTLAGLLKSPSSHTLQCLRWFHQPLKTRFGLVFAYPSGYVDIKTLHEIIKTTPPNQGPTLGQRFQIARDIGDAVLKWHTSANWVHQEIASYNICFFRSAGSDRIDYLNPYLCGFEFSRHSKAPSLNHTVEDFERNIYRHQARQGEPSEYHTKSHDLYSYGVFLLEVGIWSTVSNFFNEKMRTNLSPPKMQKYLQTIARQRLGHCMGSAYERAANRCLTMDFGVELDDLVGSKLAKAFQELVLQELEPGTRLDCVNQS